MRVAGCGKACEIAENEYKENSQKLKSLKGALEELLNASGVDYHYNGNQDCCVDSSANICFKGVMSEALMLSSKQYCSVSNGSACTSKSYSPTNVSLVVTITRFLHIRIVLGRICLLTKRKSQRLLERSSLWLHRRMLNRYLLILRKNSSIIDYPFIYSHFPHLWRFCSVVISRSHISWGFRTSFEK